MAYECDVCGERREFMACFPGGNGEVGGTSSVCQGCLEDALEKMRQEIAIKHPLAVLENNPNYKRVDVTLVLHAHEMVPKDWDDNSIRFYIEENHCLDNYVRQIQREIDAEPNKCRTCSRGGEAFVGNLKLRPA